MDWNIIGLVISVASIAIGVATSYYFYRKSIRIKDPCYDVKSNNLVQGYISSIPRLVILYEDKKIENITVSRVVFWNNGDETINASDITSAEPIRIEGLGKTQVLNCKIVTSNNSANRLLCELDASKNVIYIKFDYLDKLQGGVLQILHTGVSSNDIKVCGAVKGAKGLRRRRVDYGDVTPVTISKMFRVSTRRLITTAFYLLSGLLFAAMGLLGTIAVYLAVSSPESPSSDRVLGNPVIIVVVPVMALLGIFMIWISAVLWRDRPPRGLEVFMDDDMS